jgi:hypothetical protein
MSIAQALTQRMNQKSVTRSSKSIYTVVSDDHNVHCMTEDMLDAWWASLPPEQKATVYEADLDGLLDETVALANPLASGFQSHVEKFFGDMERIQKSPFTGLTREVANGHNHSQL